MARHSKALLPTWQDALEAAGQRGSNVLQQQLAAVAASGTATDARFKAYVGLLLGLINVSVQVRRAVKGAWGCLCARPREVGGCGRGPVAQPSMHCGARRLAVAWLPCSLLRQRISWHS